MLAITNHLTVGSINATILGVNTTTYIQATYMHGKFQDFVKIKACFYERLILEQGTKNYHENISIFKICSHWYVGATTDVVKCQNIGLNINDLGISNAWVYWEEHLIQDPVLYVVDNWYWIRL